jgi:hypothetical protein
MSCHVCGQEAVGRCYNCGALFCAQHGDTNCFRCDTSFMAGDPRPDRISAAPRQTAPHAGWWRPQPAEAYTPPACYECQGIARRVCANCQQRYCPEHAGKNGVCAECHQSSYVGIAILGAIAVVFGIVLLIGWWQRIG